ncbi:MAG: hypothetical protein KC503_25495 [Myxococcales bacterium]|nr:hypothetical protein [Myxococcales bacterium]
MRRLARREKQSNNKDNTYLRKDRQLCREAARALSLTLAAEPDEVAQLDVVRVDPWPDASRLKVIVVAPPDSSADEALELLELVRLRAPRLRRLLAAALDRRRVPDLVYEIAPMEVRHG